MQLFLVFAIAFVPFTSLRIGPVGFGELIILLVFFKLLILGRIRKRNIIKSGPFLMLWVSLILFSLLGASVNAFYYSFESGLEGTGFFDFFSYIFIIISIITISEFAHVSSYNGIIFKRIFDVWAFSYVFLFLLSLFFGSIFGLNLKYYDNFSPLVDNVHQAASVVSVLGFLMLYRASSTDSNSAIKFILFVSGLLLFLMAFKSGSTKGSLAVLFGLFSMLLCKSFSLLSAKYRKVFYFFGVISFFVFIIYLYFGDGEIISQILVGAFVEADGGGARANLYLNGINHFLGSPLFGYGPGSHTPYANGFSDAHNTLLTVLLQSGLFGAVSVLIFFAYLFSRASFNYILFGALSSATIYFLGGDILRRLPTWIMLLGIYYFSFECRKNKLVKLR